MLEVTQEQLPEPNSDLRAFGSLSAKQVIVEVGYLVTVFVLLQHYLDIAAILKALEYRRYDIISNTSLEPPVLGTASTRNPR